ncbi:TPA: hypothetical protein ACGO1J_001770 [Streptococcus suis]|mgnify:CR=1 FL=1|uniref:Uncharacterized protein n=1 Tax=Streptococcus gallolyticus TaxID=315405 RepID=A0A380JYR6_9STRE|nr:Glycerophosphoryl diester phosphodiesterase [Streptococcus thermophilus]CAD0162774.1 Glycerophosphoryl diester phosphodiesterase [Streptococcus thermophilus]SUN57971.1 Uncharacterised protein [Streptococcus gallolyticus]
MKRVLKLTLYGSLELYLNVYLLDKYGLESWVYWLSLVLSLLLMYWLDKLFWSDKTWCF